MRTIFIIFLNPEIWLKEGRETGKKNLMLPELQASDIKIYTLLFPNRVLHFAVGSYTYRTRRPVASNREF
jgi:hypothetical protein